MALLEGLLPSHWQGRPPCRHWLPPTATCRPLRQPKLRAARRAHQVACLAVPSSSKRPGQHNGAGSTGRQQDDDNDGSCSAEDLAARHLAARIKGATSLHNLSAIIKEKGSTMNQMHITAFIVKLSRVAQQERLVPRQGFTGTDAAEQDWMPEQDLSMPRGSSSSVWDENEARPQDDQHSGGDDDGNTSSLPSQSTGRRPHRQWWRQRGSPDDKQQLLQDVCIRAVDVLQPTLFEMDGRGIVNVLYALAKLGLRHPVTEDLLYLSTEWLPQYNTQGFSNLIYAAALLCVRPSRQWLSAFFRHSLPQLTRFSTQGLANTLWALAKLHLPPGISTSSRDWEKAMYVAIEQQLATPGCTPQAISNICWSLAKLDLFPPEHLLRSLASAAVRQLHSFPPQALANTLWGLARMRAHLTPDWWAHFRKVTYDQLESYNDVVLATLLYSMSLLSHNPNAALEPAFASHVTQPSPRDGSPPSQGSITREHVVSHNGHTPVLPPGHDVQDPSKLSQMSHVTQSQAQAQHSPGRHAAELPPSAALAHHSTPLDQAHHIISDTASLESSDWGHRFQRRLQAVLPTCSPYTLAIMLYSWGKLRAKPEPGLLDALLDHCEPVLKDMSPQSLSNVMWGVARLEVVPEVHWRHTFLAASYDKLPLMNAQELSNVMRGLAVLRVWPDGLWMSRMVYQSGRHIQDYQPQNLANTVHAFATLGYVPGKDWYQAFLKRLDSQMPKMAAVQLSDTIWAVSQLGLQLPASLSSRVVNGITADLATVDSKTLASTLIAMTRLQLPLQPSLLSMFTFEIESGMSELDMPVLSQVVWALSCAKYQPGARFLHTLDTLVIQHINAEVSRGRAPPTQPTNQSSAAPTDGAKTAAAAPARGSVGVGAQASGPGMKITAHMDAICQFAFSRSVLGPVQGSALPQALITYLQWALAQNCGTAAQVLLAMQGITNLGYTTQADLMQALTHQALTCHASGVQLAGLQPAINNKAVRSQKIVRPVPKQLPLA